MRFKVYNIHWDTTSDQEVFESLPQYVEVSVDDEDNIADALSDAYGWCIFSYESMPIT